MEIFIGKDKICPHMVIIPIGVKTGSVFHIQQVKEIIVGGWWSGNGGKINFCRRSKKKKRYSLVSPRIGFDRFEAKYSSTRK